MFVSWKRNVLLETVVLFTERWRHLTYSNEPNFINNVLLVAKEYFQFKLSNVTKRANWNVCMESYYFHKYSVSCDVHFRYSDDAFMWTA